MKRIKVRISFRWLKLVCKLPMIKISIEKEKPQKEKPKFKL